MKTTILLLAGLMTTLTALAASSDAEEANTLVQWKTNDQKVQVRRETDGSLKIKGGTFDKSTLKKSGDAYSVGDKTASGWKISDAKGKLLHEITIADEQYRLLENGKLVARVKIKSDKANLYGADDKRTAHVKKKEDGGYSVKPEAGSAILASKIKGAGSLKEASYLALPLPDDEKILFWSLEKKP